MPSEKLGWIGLGNIGAPMAQRFVDHPGGLVVCDTSVEACAGFADQGVEVVSDAAAVLGAGATFVSIVVRTDTQVRAVVASLLDAGPVEGTIFAIHSTIEPETAEELSVQAALRGAIVVDAPVSGGFMGAAQGRLAVLLGAPDSVVERTEAALSAMADLVVHFGPPGAGTRAKIARNLITFTSYAMVAEAQRLAEGSGIDLVQLGKVVRHSDAVTGGPGAVMIRPTTAPLAVGDPLRDIFAHSVELGTKDLDLALSMAADQDLDLALTALARTRLAASLGIDTDEAS